MTPRTRLFGWLAGAVLTASVLSSAAHAGAPCPLPEDPVVLLNALWPIVDTNGDGNLSLSEGQALYLDLDAAIFGYADLDHNGKVSRAEVMTLLPLLPVDILDYVDPNGDGIIVYSEVDDYVTQAEFNSLDRDHNGRIDCNDLGEAPGEGEPEGEVDPGEGEGEFDPGNLDIAELCGYLPLVESLFPSVDADNNGGISRAELTIVAQTAGLAESDIDIAFAVLDLNHDELISLAEIHTLAEVYCTAPGEGEVEGEVEGEPVGLETLCSYAPMAISLFPTVDVNDDGVITLVEFESIAAQLGAVLPDLAPLFALADADQSGGISLDELEAFIAVCNGTGEGENEGEGGLDWAAVCQYLPLVDDVFPGADGDGSGGLTLEELTGAIAFFVDPGVNFAALFPLLDADNSGEATLAEIQALGAQVCGHVGEGEGEGEGEPDLLSLCGNLPLIDSVFPSLDTDHSGGLSLAEIQPVLLTALIEQDYDVSTYFAQLDLDNNGEITLAEIHAVAAQICGSEGEGEGEGEGEIDLSDICQYLPLVDSVFPSFDPDGSGGLTEPELRTALLMVLDPAINIDPLFPLLDTDDSGEVTLAEIHALGAQVCGTVGEGEGEGEVEGDLDAYCAYLPMVIAQFPSLDRNNSDGISRSEVTPLLLIVNPSPEIDLLFAILDMDQNDEITVVELQAAAAQFCGDPGEGESEGELEGEGEVGSEGEPELTELCAYLPLARSLFHSVDADDSGDISLAELESIANSVGLALETLMFYFDTIDASGDGALTLAEIDATAAAECGIVITEPGETSVTMMRSAGGSNTYVPGGTLRVSVTLSKSGPGVVNALGITETLPPGWSLAAVIQDGGVESAPAAGTQGTLEFAWLTMPAFPVTVVYDVAVPEDASGIAEITGAVLYRIGDATEESSAVITTTLHAGSDTGFLHSADRDGDWRIVLSEVLRVIQIYNLGGYHCDATGEDGYAPGLGDVLCAPHTSDYTPQNWVISLSELLRMVQLYNAHSGAYYSAAGTEDGYAPGVYSGQ